MNKNGKEKPSTGLLTAGLGNVPVSTNGNTHATTKHLAIQPAHVIDRAARLLAAGDLQRLFADEHHEIIGQFWQATAAFGLDYDMLKAWDSVMGGNMMTGTSAAAFWRNSQHFAPERFQTEARGKATLRPSNWQAKVMGAHGSHLPASVPPEILRRPMSELTEEIGPEDAFPVEGEIYVADLEFERLHAIFSGKRIVESGITKRVFIGEDGEASIFTPDQPVYQGVDKKFEVLHKPTYQMKCHRLQRVKPAFVNQMALAYEYFQRAARGRYWRNVNLPWLGGGFRLWRNVDRIHEYPFQWWLETSQYIHTFQPVHTYGRDGLWGEREALEARDDAKTQLRVRLLQMGAAGEFSTRDALHSLRRQYDKETVNDCLAALVDAGELSQQAKQGKRGPATAVYVTP